MCLENSSQPFCNYTSKQYSQTDLFTNYSKILSESEDICKEATANSVPCTFFSHYCTLISNSQNCDIFMQTNANTKLACLSYRESYHELIDNFLIPNSFDYNSMITVILGVFSPTGEFLGYSNFKKEVNSCGAKDGQNHLWTKFGNNFYQSCRINLSYLPLNLYEPFIYIENDDTFIPIPVVPKNYVLNGQYVNQENENHFLSRFFLYDNYSTQKTQYASDINLHFQINEDDEKRLHLPYLTIDYKTGVNAQDWQNFQFSATYSKNDQTFETLGITVIIVFIILGVAYFIGSFFINVRSYSVDGMNSHVLFSILGTFFYAIGLSFFLISVFIGIYLICGFKLPSHPFMTLKPAKSYLSYQIFLYISLGITFIGTVFKVLNQSNNFIFVIDWDERSSTNNKNKHLRRVSQYRQSSAAYEWFKLSTIRRVDPIFVVITVLLFLRALNLDYLQQPIPSLELIDAGQKYRIIELGLTSFLWVSVSLVFCLLKQFVYWGIYGNPFISFRMLCLSMNISVVMMINSSRGFLIHGRQRISRGFNLANNENFDDEDSFDPENSICKTEVQTRNSSSTIPETSDISDESERSVRRYAKKTGNTNSTPSPNSLFKKHKIVNYSEETNSNQTSGETDQSSYETYYSGMTAMTDSQEKQLKKTEKIDISENYQSIPKLQMKNSTFGAEYMDKLVPKEEIKKAPKKLLVLDVSKTEEEKHNSTDDNLSADVDIDESSKSTESRIQASDSDKVVSIHNETKEVDESDNKSDIQIDSKSSKSSHSDNGTQESTKKESQKSTNETSSKSESQPKKTNIQKSSTSTELDCFSESEKGPPATDAGAEETLKRVNSNYPQKNLPHYASSTSSKDIVLRKLSDNQPMRQSLKAFSFNPVTYESVESAASISIDSTYSYTDVGLLSSSYSSELDESATIKEQANISKAKENTRNRAQKVSSHAPKEEKTTKKDFQPDSPPTYKPFQRFNDVHTFEIFLDQSLFYFVNKNNEMISYKLAHGGKIHKSLIRKEMEETNTSLVMKLSDEENPQFEIEPMSLVHKIAGLGPVAEEKSIFTIQTDSSYAQTMLYGIEGALLFFYLIVFAAIESFSNASIAGLIVLLIDLVIIKVFKWRRRKYLIDHDLCIYRSLVR